MRASLLRRRTARAGSALMAGAIGLALVPATGAEAATVSLRAVDATVTEADAAGRVANVKVKLSRKVGKRVTVDYRTVNGTALAGQDYTAKSGTLVFPAGTRTRTVAVPITGDLLDERDERFKLRLSDPFRARIADSVAVVKITDNDAPPALSVGSASVVEPNAGASQAITLPVSLSAPSARNVSVAYTVTPGTASVNADYTGTLSGTVTFPAGTTSRSVPLSVLGDNVDEANETLNVALTSPVNATISVGNAVGTIIDNDGPSVSITDVSRLEGWTTPNWYHFTASLSAPSPQEVRVNWSTVNSTAVSGSDYIGASGTLIFAPGQTSRTVSVQGRGDILTELNESFVVLLSSPTNASVSDGHGVGTLVNDDCSGSDSGSASALNLGSVSGDTGSGVLSRSSGICVGEADWHRFRMTENNDDFFTAKDLTARIYLNVLDGPAQTAGDLDVCVYRSNLSLIGCSQAGGTSDDVFFIKKDDVDFSWDHSDIYVKVFGKFGQQMNNYSLSVNGNFPTGISPNV